jgi:hypothetical protein
MEQTMLKRAMTAGIKPSEIRKRVKAIIEEAGPDYLVVTTTGTPLERINTETERNYHAMIDAVLDLGKTKA